MKYVAHLFCGRYYTLFPILHLSKHEKCPKSVRYIYIYICCIRYCMIVVVCFHVVFVEIIEFHFFRSSEL